MYSPFPKGGVKARASHRSHPLSATRYSALPCISRRQSANLRSVHLSVKEKNLLLSTVADAFTTNARMVHKMANRSADIRVAENAPRISKPITVVCRHRLVSLVGHDARCANFSRHPRIANHWTVRVNPTCCNLVDRTLALILERL